MIKLLKNANVYTPEPIGVKDVLIIDETICRIDDKIEGYEAEVVNLRGNYWTITLSAKDVVAEKANPETGAADFVGAAVAMAVVSVAAAGALTLKNN